MDSSAWILEELLEQRTASRVAHALFDLFDALQLEEGRTPRIVLRHARAPPLVGGHVDIGAQLDVEVMLDVPAVQNVAEETREARGPSHCLASGSGGDGGGDGPGDELPARRFRVEVAAARLGELVELRPAVVFRLAPLGLQPALLFEAVERGKERTGLDVEGAAGDLRDSARDAKAVIGAQRKRAQNQQIERPLENSA
jgi:hypothetical protein